jgi:hypothetical protein
LKRKLLLLNLGLAILIAAVVVHLRREWMESRAREWVVLQQRIKPAPAPPVIPLPPAETVKAASYRDIAEKMLFSKDRNPTVIVEAPAPPPPKPMPPLPVFHGVLNLGDGPTAIMSEKPGAAHRDFRPGDQVGAFKLVALDADEIVLEWDGKTITKKVEELIDHSAPPPPAPAKVVAVAAPPAEQPAPPKSAPAAPGVDLGGRGIRACQPGDSSPAGTVADGMRKVIKSTPFGKNCYWEPAS